MFEIKGTDVNEAELIRLQTLAVDIQQLASIKTRSRRAGDQRSVFRGQGREFKEMKPYQTGDDVRQIDWRLTAKKQSPFVRVMEEDRHNEHVVWLDLSSSAYFGTQQCFKSVLACHWTAFLIWRFVHLKHPVKLVIQVGDDWQEEIKISRYAHAAQACKIIAQGHEYLAANYRNLKASTLRKPVFWIGQPNLWWISDAANGSELFKTILETRRVGSANCLQPLDSFDKHLPMAGALPVKHQGVLGHIQTNDKSVQQSYLNAFEQREQKLNELCWAHSGALYSSTTEDFNWQEVQAWPLYH